jgi:hypothetical protein
MVAFFNSQLGLLIIGFIFTSVLGALVAKWLQERSWHRQTRVDLFRKRYDEGVELLDRLSTLIGQRSFALQRLLWGFPEADDATIQRLKTETSRIVFRWNADRWRNRNKIRLLVGSKQANAFLDYHDNFFPETPTSIHYTFVKAHNYVIQAVKKQISIAAAQEQIDELNIRCSNFLESLTTDFAIRANALELLQEPPPRADVAYAPGADRDNTNTAREFIDLSSIRWPWRIRRTLERRSIARHR